MSDNIHQRSNINLSQHSEQMTTHPEKPHIPLTPAQARRRGLTYTLGGMITGFSVGIGWIVARRLPVAKTLTITTAKGTFFGFLYSGYSNFLDMQQNMPITSFSNSALSGSITFGAFGLFQMSAASTVQGILLGSVLGCSVNVLTSAYTLAKNQHQRKKLGKAVEVGSTKLDVTGHTTSGAELDNSTSIFSLNWLPIQKATPKELEEIERKEKIQKEYIRTITNEEEKDEKDLPPISSYFTKK
jgi:hypothetical protein